MRKIECDVCGKIISIKDAYDEDGHTTKDGYVHLTETESRDYRNEYDICIACYKEIKAFVREQQL